MPTDNDCDYMCPTGKHIHQRDSFPTIVPPLTLEKGMIEQTSFNSSLMNKASILHLERNFSRHQNTNA